MEIKNGRISILIGTDETTIEIIDSDASITFVRVKLTPEQLSSALSRLAYTKTKSMDVYGLDNIGKKHENAEHIFEIPAECYDKMDLEKVKEEATKTAPDGWIPDTYYGSKGSFFEKDNRKYARVTIRRWV